MRAIPAIALLAIAAACVVAAQAGELTGYASLESRYFPEEPLDPEQFEGVNFSAALSLEYYIDWDDYSQRFVVSLFGRLDQHDSRRSHFDIRELYWEKVGRWLEVRAGLRKVFWGVTESQHVVDIINQTDLVENVDAEEKLGQPMVDAAIITDYGVVELYAMPFFRERTFPGVEGRLRTIPYVDVDRPLYESSAEQTHFDWAVRYSRTFGIFDLGVAHLSGTSRQPQFAIDTTNTVLQPFYEIMRQTSADVQATTGAALWKFEGFYNDGIAEPFVSLTGGIEYTFFTLFGSSVDLGALAEYSYDDRDNFQIVPFQDDIFVGARLALNDVQDTQILGGVVKDLDVSTTLSFIEASRRIGDRWRLEFEFRGFHNVHPDDVLTFLKRDSYLQLDIARYF